ncbi:hypothetical protein KIN20_009909 [Parelaphostrongylus tenuis]|uniref:Uncharacterized protein n=1 Tax=Parelaphostrongylus tenuis TaxID=148309 RepID=A0AAD5QJZ5_PARTN|nr:hypothetical protein KIN20_009909 [Parelaphostrongylus tenuis]
MVGTGLICPFDTIRLTTNAPHNTTVRLPLKFQRDHLENPRVEEARDSSSFDDTSTNSSDISTTVSPRTETDTTIAECECLIEYEIKILPRLKPSFIRRKKDAISLVKHRSTLLGNGGTDLQCPQHLTIYESLQSGPHLDNKDSYRFQVVERFLIVEKGHNKGCGAIGELQ